MSLLETYQNAQDAGSVTLEGFRAQLVRSRASAEDLAARTSLDLSSLVETVERTVAQDIEARTKDAVGALAAGVLDRSGIAGLADVLPGLGALTATLRTRAEEAGAGLKNEVSSGLAAMIRSTASSEQLAEIAGSAVGSAGGLIDTLMVEALAAAGLDANASRIIGGCRSLVEGLLKDGDDVLGAVQDAVADVRQGADQLARLGAATDSLKVDVNGVADVLAAMPGKTIDEAADFVLEITRVVETAGARTKELAQVLDGLGFHDLGRTVSQVGAMIDVVSAMAAGGCNPVAALRSMNAITSILGGSQPDPKEELEKARFERIMAALNAIFETVQAQHREEMQRLNEIGQDVLSAVTIGQTGLEGDLKLCPNLILPANIDDQGHVRVERIGAGVDLAELRRHVAAHGRLSVSLALRALVAHFTLPRSGRADRLDSRFLLYRSVGQENERQVHEHTEATRMFGELVLELLSDETLFLLREPSLTIAELDAKCSRIEHSSAIEPFVRRYLPFALDVPYLEVAVGYLLACRHLFELVDQNGNLLSDDQLCDPSLRPSREGKDCLLCAAKYLDLALSQQALQCGDIALPMLRDFGVSSTVFDYAIRRNLPVLTWGERATLLAALASSTAPGYYRLAALPPDKQTPDGSISTSNLLSEQIERNMNDVSHAHPGVLANAMKYTINKGLAGSRKTYPEFAAVLKDAPLSRLSARQWQIQSLKFSKAVQFSFRIHYVFDNTSLPGIAMGYQAIVWEPGGTGQGQDGDKPSFALPVPSEQDVAAGTLDLSPVLFRLRELRSVVQSALTEYDFVNDPEGACVIKGALLAA